MCSTLCNIASWIWRGSILVTLRIYSGIKNIIQMQESPLSLRKDFITLKINREVKSFQLNEEANECKWHTKVEFLSTAYRISSIPKIKKIGITHHTSKAALQPCWLSLQLIQNPMPAQIKPMRLNLNQARSCKSILARGSSKLRTGSTSKK